MQRRQVTADANLSKGGDPLVVLVSNYKLLDTMHCDASHVRTIALASEVLVVVVTGQQWQIMRTVLHVYIIASDLLVVLVSTTK